MNCRNWSTCLRGDMSLVGPRPLIVDEDSQVIGWHRGRLDLTPGMTGVWQILPSTRLPLDDMVTLDYLYIVNWSLWADVQILLRTIPHVLGRRGAVSAAGAHRGVSDPYAPAAAAGIHRLAIPTPFAVGRVNVYLIDDDPLTLVDAGPNSGTSLDELQPRHRPRSAARSRTSSW